MDQDSTDRLKVEFETFAGGVLQAAVEYVAGVPGVDRIWIYTILSPSSISAGPYYRLNGSFYPFGKLDSEFPEHGYDGQTLFASIKEFAIPFFRFLRDSPLDMPERIIITYDPEAGTMESSWDYEGTKDHPEDSGWTARDEWIKSMGGVPVFARNREPSE